jgi:hypothetical protein
VELVLSNVAKPENVVGFTFLEELPQHLTSGHEILGWKRGEPMPWDIAGYEDTISADLGEPFDMAITSHRLWWGQKYARIVSLINQTIKDTSGGYDVFVWPQTGFRTLDMLEPGESIFQDDVLPIHYADLIQTGLVDGVFGYPNTEATLTQRAALIAEEFGIAFWSQLSTPGYMRTLSWDDTLRIATEGHPANLGVMLYAEPSTGAGVWNKMPYEDGVTEWSVEGHARKLAEMLLSP